MEPPGGHRVIPTLSGQSRTQWAETELLYSKKIQTIRTSIPAIDLDEWKTWCSPSQISEVTKTLTRIEQKIASSRSAKPAGQWSRLERQHGRLRLRFPTSPWARAVAEGLEHSLKFLPMQVTIPPYPSSGPSKQVLLDCMRLWIANEICRPVTAEQWQEHLLGERHLRYLPLFVVKKPGKKEYYVYETERVTDKWRPCMNAKSLNAALRFCYFKQSNHVELDCLSERGDLCAKTDVHSAFQILLYSPDPIDPARFGLTTSSDLMCFTSPPELASSAPRGFQLIVNTFGTSNAPLFLRSPYKLVLDDLRGLGLHVGNVCDDNMVHSKASTLPTSDDVSSKAWRAKSVFSCLADTETLVDRHIYFGIPLSSKDVRESITPTRLKEMNGMLIDHDNRTKYWPQRKVDNVLAHIDSVLTSTSEGKLVVARSLASLLGKLESATQGLFGVGLFTDGLQSDLKKALRLSTAGPFPVSPAQAYKRAAPLSLRSQQRLHFLRHNAFEGFNGKMMIHGSAVKYHLQTDWSSYGWGAWTLGPGGVPVTVSVPLDPAWRTVWSRAGETWTAVQAIIAIAEAYSWSEGIISILMDNVAAVSNVNKMKSKSPKISAILMQLFLFLGSRNLMAIAGWIAGDLIKADAPSRPRPSIHDGELSTPIYDQSCRVHLTRNSMPLPQLDLFATHLNRKTDRFVSLYPNPGAEWINSMKCPWWPIPPRQSCILYGYPPQILLLSAIKKLMAEKQTMLLIFPVTTRTPFPQLGEALVTVPLFFPWDDTTVLNPQVDMMSLSERPYLQGKWILASALISGEPSVREDLRKKSSELWLPRSWELRRVWCTKSGCPSDFTARLTTWITSCRTALLRSNQ